MKVKSLSHVALLATPWTAAYQAPLSMGFFKERVMEWGAITFSVHYGSVRFSSVTQSCLTLCHPINRSTLGLPVHHLCPEFTQSHVHQVGDAIQPSHPLSSPSPPAPNPSHILVFSNESTLCMRWPKYWSFNFNISPSNEHTGLVGYPCSPRDS